jgi:hypothetical protein
MTDEARVDIAKQVATHGAAETEAIARLRALSMRQRGHLIEAACEAAA